MQPVRASVKSAMSWRGMMQVRDFLMRVKSGRFPTIEKDLKMLLAHSGSLFLDPAALAEVCFPPLLDTHFLKYVICPMAAHVRAGNVQHWYCIHMAAYVEGLIVDIHTLQCSIILQSRHSL